MNDRRSDVENFVVFSINQSFIGFKHKAHKRKTFN